MTDFEEGIRFVFGENTDSPQWIEDVVINKNTPMYQAIFAKMRDIFWGFVKKLIDLFS